MEVACRYCPAQWELSPHHLHKCEGFLFSEMSKIKEIRVRVTFEVGIDDIDADEIQIQQLNAAAINSATISQESRWYPFAAEWLNANVDQHQSLGHEYEIISIETAEQ